MTDLELVKLAAKAENIAYIGEMSEPHPVSGAWWGLWIKYDREPHEFDRRYWNPLADDGDALRLAVGLGLLDGGSDYLTFRTQEIQNGHDPFAATRRAIVRAAAEVGRANQTKVEN